MKKIAALSLCVCVVLSFFAACKKDGTIDESTIQGKWEVVEARRNGKVTGTLHGAFFEFTEDKMKTNITGQEQTSDISYNGLQIRATGGSDNARYNVEKIDEDNLILKTNLRNFDFIFRLQRTSEG